jgi:hypothetical protein
VDEINTLTGRLGRVPNISVKTALSRETAAAARVSHMEE